jgi:hypothetical protein
VRTGPVLGDVGIGDRLGSRLGFTAAAGPGWLDVLLFRADVAEGFKPLKNDSSLESSVTAGTPLSVASWPPSGSKSAINSAIDW